MSWGLLGSNYDLDSCDYSSSEEDHMQTERSFGWGKEKEMFETNSTIVSQALTLWANYIETGDVNMSGVDSDDRGRSKNNLSSSQLRLVAKIKWLSQLALTRKLDLTKDQ